MKTTVVPAQITTVEDKIAGTLTFPQIILLVSALIIGAAIYSGIPPKIHFTLVKISLIAFEWLFFGGLALRVRGKIVGDWLVLHLRFVVRPRLYVFTKNDLFGRDIIKEAPAKAVEVKEDEAIERVNQDALPLAERIKLDRLFDNPAFSVRFRLGRKGGLDVCLKPVEE